MDDPGRTRTRQQLGLSNRRAVLAEIVLRGPVSRTGIARATGLTMASVSRISRDLLDAGLVRELGSAPAAGSRRPRPGRPLVELDLEPRGGFVLGIGVNLFSQCVALADLKNRCIARIELGLDALDDPDEVIERLLSAAGDLIESHVGDRRRLLGGALAITGAVDPVEGVVRTSPYLGWGVVPLGDAFADALGVPLRVESMPNAIALAETRFGSARNRRDVLLLNCSLGVGAGLVLDGRLVRGHRFQAGMIGRMVPSGQDGEGHSLDRLAGGHGVLRRMSRSETGDADRTASEMARALLAVLDAAREGEPLAREVLAGAGRDLGRVAAQLAVLVAPEVVAVAGPLACSEVYLDGVRNALNGPLARPPLELVPTATTGESAARSLAIAQYLFETDVDLDRLKLARAA